MMKMWSVDVIILLLFCYACLSTGNGRVHFVSRNFYNVLHWDAVRSVPPQEEVRYSVQYWSDADEPVRIREACQNTSALSCDLTAVTPSVPDVHYHAQVLANGRLLNRTVNRFKPIADTVLSSPNISIHTTVSSLYVNVTLPLGPNGVSVADIISRSKNGPSNTIILYNVNITEPKWAALVKESTTGRFVLNLKNNRTKYCGYVVYKPNTEWGRNRSEPTSFCVTLPETPRVLLPWIITGAALLVAVVMASVWWTCSYVKVGKHTNMPHSLATTPGGASCKVLQTPDSRIIISTPVIDAPSGRTVYATIQAKPEAPAVTSGGYSPQDIPQQPWQACTESSEGTVPQGPTPNPVDVSGQSSEIYSAVAAHVPAEENQDLPQVATDDRDSCATSPPSSAEWDESGRHPEPALRDADACERPLLLNAVRDANGQLMLPLLTLCSGESVSPLDPQRKPLLSDLLDSRAEEPSLASLQRFDSSEWSDSGCDDSSVNTPTQPQFNTSYLPTQPVVSTSHQQSHGTQPCDAPCGSGYKENWMPAIVSEAASRDSCDHEWTSQPWTWTSPPKEEERTGDTDRGEDAPNQILLGSWLVQIQE